jgi:predicted MFS family arabinose efflux permease
MLSAISFFSYMDRRALAILLEPIKAELHFSDTQMGLLSGLAFAAVYAIMGLPLARIADRSSRPKLLAACLTFWTLMTAVSGFVRSFPQLFLARMGVGVGEAGCLPAAHSLLGDYFPPERRTLAIAIFQSGAVLGLSGGLFLIGNLGQHIGWRASLQVIGIAGVPLALLVLFTVPELRRTEVTGASREPALTVLGALLRKPALVHLMIAYAISGGFVTGSAQWFPAFFMRSFGMSVGQVGAWVGSAELIGGVAGLLSGGFAAARMVPRDPRWEVWMPAIAFSICAPLFALMFISPNPWIALPLKMAADFLSAFGSAITLSAIQSFAEKHRRATAVSMVLFTSSLIGSGLGPYAIGALSDILAPVLGRESLRYALLASCAALVWSVFHYLCSARRTLQDRVA